MVKPSKLYGYHMNVLWSQEDGCWIADVPDLRYCSGHGDSPEAAVANAQSAVAGWLEVARERGLAEPEPRYRPDAA